MHATGRRGAGERSRTNDTSSSDKTRKGFIVQVMKRHVVYFDPNAAEERCPSTQQEGVWSARPPYWTIFIFSTV